MTRGKLLAVLGFSLAGLALSGYLSYQNLWGTGCETTVISCGGAQAVYIFGYPTCVYGFFMFLAVAVVALFALGKRSSRGLSTALVALGTVGTLFAGSLTVYELWIRKIEFVGIPACLYGAVFYVGVLAFSVLARRDIFRPSTPTQGATV